jgi:hypothetical protein
VTQNKYFAGPAALLDTLCDITNQADFDAKLKTVANDSE